MKKQLLLTAGIFLIGFSLLSHAQAPFSRGVNLTGWFQTSGSHQIQFTKYTRQDFVNIKSLGCDVIRLPINLFYMAGSKPDYTLDPLFYQFLDQAVSWAEELHIYLLLDNHSSDDIASFNPDLEAILSKTWLQMATHYKNRSSYIMYEIMNEPHGITTQAWGKIQQTAITAIRSVDPVHTLIVGPSSYNSYTDLSLLPVYTDPNLIYTFHFYDPFVFTHQGATWPSPSMASLANVPFPYNAATMPAVPSDLAGTWVAGSIGNYMNEGTVAKVHALLDMAVTFKTSRNVKLYCGEFGVYTPNSNDADRVNWYREVRSYLEQKGIAWTTWDYQGGFGLFKKGSNEQFLNDLNVPLVQVLGLTAPVQQVFVLKPDTVGITVYTDFIGEKIQEASNASGATIDFYSTEKPNNGTYCLYWNGSAQYGTLGFDFLPDKDLSTLKAQNYALSLLVKGNTPGTQFDLRFIDTKTSVATDHPWRMNYTVDDTKVPWDNAWHKLYIPLSQFIEGGSWDNAWYPAIGVFDWKAVDRFNIVAEQASLANKSFWFDNIQLTNRDTARVLNTALHGIRMDTNLALKVFPNPAIHSTTIYYTLPKSQSIDISIYTVSGQKVRTIFHSTQPAGEYSILWNMNNDRGFSVPEGIYFCTALIGDRVCNAKIIVL
ncbi:MAG: cellulase family glycosylhydrolase [Paludibacter sp.]|nr:cellulase family glycosylhydrolase [Paludibacter sp.]